MLLLVIIIILFHYSSKLFFLFKECEYEGVIYYPGETFESFYDPCTECRCDFPDVACYPRYCPKPVCMYPAPDADGCCQMCYNCLFEEVLYYNGQHFPDPRDPCAQCACRVTICGISSLAFAWLLMSPQYISVYLSQQFNEMQRILVQLKKKIILLTEFVITRMQFTHLYRWGFSSFMICMASYISLYFWVFLITVNEMQGISVPFKKKKYPLYKIFYYKSAAYSVV